MPEFKHSPVIILIAVLAFLLGRQNPELLARPAGLSAASFQGRRVPGEPEKRAPITPPSFRSKAPLIYETSGSSSASGDGLIAVTGSYGIGTSVLYVLDARSKQLAVYEARGGAGNSRRLFLVGARRIELDLRLEGYNDESEHSYEDLARRFRELGLSGEESSLPAKGPKKAGK
ncbi:MAG: hypothetical protein ACE5F1_04825 [Planctomycetota bacterium]